MQVCGGVHVYGKLHVETRGPPWSFFRRHLPCFMRWSFSVGWSPVSRLGCLSSQPQGSFCLHQPTLGLHGLHTCLFTWVLGIELWSSLLSIKHFIKCTIPIALIQLRLSLTCLCSQGWSWTPEPPSSTECWCYKHTLPASCILKLMSTVSHMGFYRIFFLSELRSSHSFFSTIITDFLSLLLVTTFW